MPFTYLFGFINFHNVYHILSCFIIFHPHPRLPHCCWLSGQRPGGFRAPRFSGWRVVHSSDLDTTNSANAFWRHSEGILNSLNFTKCRKMWSKITEPVVRWMQKDWESLSDRMASHWVGSCWTHESWANRLPQRLGGRPGQLRFRQVPLETSWNCRWLTLHVQMTLDGTYGIRMNSIDIQQVPTYSNM
jgi:hypothetical protein